ncbi:UDP-N-acetylglucosamine--dolichyl-phosphate N-acetylglucosaminephosphotransferase [Operophtera brumata]|uniref:UDP-N-acetylglucosamine--dolichyl-phosphate N-acetylglucosaminephosphotransferase n=1 Tax=Operophtera brumata TaxID=104452 RepID=A0A0L7L8G6_OPEBR|nr:UDP-N-acetylglucosamine--dolichyl-phosphate N-acetylglucosaminephosphotransferase [Operophtera brumata]
MWSIIILLILSAIAYFTTDELIPKLKELFINAGLFGIDLCKTSKNKIPEALGVVSGCVFLVTCFLFIPINFGYGLMDTDHFPHNEFAEFLAALLSICCMLLLGFADDVLDLRWRYKLLLPTVASLPLLVVYYVNFNSTTFVVPLQLRYWLGVSVNIGFLYYVYMGMLAVFCTNAINILAGINGLEVGQSVVIALSIIVFDLLELRGDQFKAHSFSLNIMIPYLATTLALLKHNWLGSSVTSVKQFYCSSYHKLSISCIQCLSYSISFHAQDTAYQSIVQKLTYFKPAELLL